MTTLVTYSNDLMSIAAEICKASALNNNVHKLSHWKRKDIVKTKFYKANKAILDSHRGDGFWCWKPFVILEELKKMKDGEILIYCDAGVEIINNVNHIIDRMDKDIFLFGNMWQHVHWCKGDVIVQILSSVYYKYEGKQAQASVIVIRNTESSRKFVKKWLRYCCEPGLIDDSPSKEPNHSEFKEHRHDQAILTCLALWENAELHWWPAMYNAGNFTYEKTGYSDTYPALFHHHRMRNSDFTATDDLNRHMQKYFKSKYSFV